MRDIADMKNTDHPDDILRELIRWAEQRDSIRAVLLTGSRANPRAKLDVFSDYDVVLVVRDIRPFFEDRSWLQDFARVLVVYRDPIHAAPGYDCEMFAYVTQYEDGLKIDFTLWPAELLRRIAEDEALPPYLDDGYEVLLDKAHLTERLKAPTYSAYIPSPPTEESYQAVVETFFSDAPYVAKNLWRDELMPAKYSMDTVMKHKYLRQMLEWRMEIDHEWSVKTGTLGKGLKRRLPPKIWAELEGTYVGAGREENWEALFKTIDLFRKVAIEVGDYLGYAYPQQLHQRVVGYLWRVKRMDQWPVYEIKAARDD